MTNIVQHIQMTNIVYYPETGKVLKHRLVKFITNGSADSQTQTDCDMGEDIESYGDTPPKIVNQGQAQPKESKESNVEETGEAGPTQTDSTQREGEKRYPTRQRKAPEYLKEYQCKAECNNDKSENVDYFYRVAY